MGKPTILLDRLLFSLGVDASVKESSHCLELSPYGITVAIRVLKTKHENFFREPCPTQAS